jgi:hypothetical protein
MGFIRNIAIKGLVKVAGAAGAAKGSSFLLSLGLPLSNRGYRAIYEESAVLSTVINKRAGCFGNAVVYVKDRQDNEAETVQARQVRSLLRQPNSLMSWEQLYRTTEVYRMLYGYCVWLKLSVSGGGIPSSLFIVDPEQLQVDFGSRAPLVGQNTLTRIRIGGQDTPFTLDDFVIFNDVKVGFGSNPILAQSRMTTLSNESNLLRVIADAELSIIRNRGALGILAKDCRDSTSAVGVYEEAVAEVQEQYKRYGISSEQWNIIITTAALKWQPITQPLKDLMLPEFEEQTAKKICAVFDVPYELFPFSKDSAFGNGGSRKQAMLELYQNVVLPLSKSDAMALTSSLCRGTGLTVTMDYSDMYIFQEEMKQKAESANIAITAFNAAQAAGNITREEWRSLASEFINIDPSSPLLEEKA